MEAANRESTARTYQLSPDHRVTSPAAAISPKIANGGVSKKKNLATFGRQPQKRGSVRQPLAKRPDNEGDHQGGIKK